MIRKKQTGFVNSYEILKRMHEIINSNLCADGVRY